jgi:hypothetical protein
LEEVRDSIEDQQRVNRLIARIDLLRTQMNLYGRTYDLVVQLTQKTELKRFQADRKIVAAKLSGHGRQKQQVERDIENVRGMAGAAREFAGLMDEVIGQLSNGARASGEAA